ncbi:hypothetical protein P7K49_009698 [Saguinus oedipus]|uniref:Uncharacterized protein n=1 Tax=Saguinus oedipus TaxID=9490 RepID=A0ABQ9VKP9_SAGOE|nr:hypothetical protein P7K49_009698 [Saguinus oedipus]
MSTARFRDLESLRSARWHCRPREAALHLQVAPAASRRLGGDGGKIAAAARARPALPIPVPQGAPALREERLRPQRPRSGSPVTRAPKKRKLRPGEAKGGYSDLLNASPKFHSTKPVSRLRKCSGSAVLYLGGSGWLGGGGLDPMTSVSPLGDPRQLRGDPSAQGRGLEGTAGGTWPSGRRSL